MTTGPDAPDPGAGQGFPRTRLSVLEALADADEGVRRESFGTLVAAYWKPVYLHLRWRWNKSAQDAEDLTQDFFALALEREFFSGYDPDQARFRTFLRVCLDRFAAKAHRAERRLKRGGGLVPLELDFAGADRAFAAAGQVTEAEADQRFHQEWVRSLFTLAVDALAAECAGTPRAIRFEVFRRYDLLPTTGTDRPSYRQLGHELGVPETQVTNHLAWARREFRRHLLERLRLLSGSEAEFRAEARALLGVEPE